MRVFFLVMLIGCAEWPAEPSGAVQFATTDQKSGLAAAQGIFLIEQVETSAWQVFYGFADNDGCGKQFDTAHTQQIETALTKTLQTWLKPLQEEGNIVAELNLQQVETINLLNPPAAMQDKKLRTFTQPTDGETAQLGVIFYCEQGTALAWLPRLPRFYDTGTASNTNTTIVLHIYPEQTPQEEHTITNLKLYSQAMLLHQAGHAFGLSDAAADATLPSLMNTSTLANFAVTDADFALPADDAEGVEWLYNYHVEQSTKLNECPEQYVYDTQRKECVAPQPLIFMVIKADLAALQTFMQENQQLDLDAQDEQGNTALHYAAEHARVKPEERGMYDHLLAAGADSSIKNKPGFTPAEVLEGSGRLLPSIQICGLPPDDYEKNSSDSTKFPLLSTRSCAITGLGSNNFVLTPDFRTRGEFSTLRFF